MSTPSLAYHKRNRKCYEAWCGTGASTWLQIDLKSERLVAFIVTRGPGQGNPVTSFYLAYSLDGTAWQDYAPGGERQVSASFVFPLLVIVYLLFYRLAIKIARTPNYCERNLKLFRATECRLTEGK